MIDPDFTLTYGERAQLSAITPQPGFGVLLHLMQSEADKFITSLINADPASPEDVLTKHLLAKAAAQFFQGITNRVNEEVALYTNAPKANDKPVDITAGVLDLGEFTEQLNNVPNLLEEIN